MKYYSILGIDYDYTDCGVYDQIAEFKYVLPYDKALSISKKLLEIYKNFTYISYKDEVMEKLLKNNSIESVIDYLDSKDNYRAGDEIAREDMLSFYLEEKDLSFVFYSVMETE